ncbi:MAG: Type 1 glutamine amidotransferase-like domain-containing protein [Ferrimicrobium sp.]
MSTEYSYTNKSQALRFTHLYYAQGLWAQVKRETEHMGSTKSIGTIALIGGAEWTAGCSFDLELLSERAPRTVHIVPTASAYESPENSVDTARTYFASLGYTVDPIMILARPDAFDEKLVHQIATAEFLYLGGGSPLHLRSVFKASPAWQALVTAVATGTTLAASSAAAMVCGDPMVDPRGGALTLGLGLLDHLAVIPHWETWPKERRARTLGLATHPTVLVGVEEATAIIRSPDGTWSVSGAGTAVCLIDQEQIPITALAASVRVLSEGGQPQVS